MLDWPPLMDAFRNGDSEAAKFWIIQDCFYIDSKDMQGRTLLHLAVISGMSDVVTTILMKSPSICNRGNIAAFHAAIIEGRREIVDTLLYYGFSIRRRDEKNNKLWYGAIRMGHFAIVASLLEYATDINSIRKLKCRCSPIIKAFSHFDVQIALDDSAAKTVLLFRLINAAVEFGHLEIINILFYYGAHVDNHGAYGKSPLQLAVEIGRLDIVRCILVQCPKISDRRNREAFLFAAMHGPASIVEELQLYGFNF